MFSCCKAAKPPMPTKANPRPIRRIPTISTPRDEEDVVIIQKVPSEVTATSASSKEISRSNSGVDEDNEKDNTPPVTKAASWPVVQNPQHQHSDLDSTLSATVPASPSLASRTPTARTASPTCQDSPRWHTPRPLEPSSPDCSFGEPRSKKRERLTPSSATTPNNNRTVDQKTKRSTAKEEAGGSPRVRVVHNNIDDKTKREHEAQVAQLLLRMQAERARRRSVSSSPRSPHRA
eukprot:Sspe_Gene.81275::Locus_51941_Transcript_1_1_Confidence_1.000_Length_1049::g.81275::m.81275